MGDSLPADKSRAESVNSGSAVPPGASTASQGNSDTSNITALENGTESDLKEIDVFSKTTDFTPNPASSPGRPTRLGDYEVLGVIAQGGMGIVYKARQSKLNRLVALKMIRAGEFADEGQVKRFYAEAEAAAQLDHPGIVPVYDVGEINGQHYFSMAYVQGRSLQDRVKSEGPIAPQEAAQLMQLVALAVQFAHDKEIVHRDIKPHNILLDENGRPHVADFGLAKQVRTGNDLTAAGQVLGTPSYMPPEQAIGKLEGVNESADVYSLGATLYCLLTGRPPFQASSVVETIQQVIHVQPVPLRRLNPEIPSDLETICLKCLQKEPHKRYITARAFAEDLGRWLENRPIIARPASNLERASRWCARNPVIAILLAVIGIAFLAGSGVAVASAIAFKQKADEIEQANKDLRNLNIQSEKRRVAAEEKRQLVQTHLYAADLHQFAQLWDAGRFDRVYATLGITRPESTGDELRGWEWYHLHDLAYSESVRFEAHSSEITACAFSPDDKTVASADQSGQILIWEARTGIVKQNIRPRISAVRKLAFSRSGAYLAVGSDDSTAILVDVSAGKTVFAMNAHILGVHALAYGPTDDLWATGSADGTINVIQRDGKSWQTSTLLGHSRIVRRLWFDKSGQRIASVSDDKTLRFWVLSDDGWQADGSLADVPATTAVSPDLKLLAYWKADEAADREQIPGIAVVDSASGRTLRNLAVQGAGVRNISFGDRIGMLAVADEQGDVYVWNFQDTAQDDARKVDFRLMARHRGAARTVQLSNSGQSVAAICTDQVIKIWPARDEGRFRFKGHQADINAVTFSPDGTLLATADMLGESRIWNRSTGELLHTLGKRWRVEGPRGTLDSAAEAAGIKEYERKNVSAMRLTGASEKWIWVFEGNAGQVDEIVFSPNGKHIASAGSDGKLWLWNVESGEAEDVLVHPQLISSAAFSPNGQWLITGCWDDRVRIWDFEQRKELRVLEGHVGNVTAVALQPSGKAIASAGADGAIRLWELETGTVIGEMIGHVGEVATVAFSGDGNLLASGGEDQVVRIWDANTRKLHFELRGHTGSVTKVVFHPEQNRLFSCSGDIEDSKVRVWDLRIGREIVALEAPGEGVLDIAMDASGQSLAVTADRSLIVWSASGKGRDPPKAISRLEAVMPEVPPGVDPPLKVLGYMRRRELMRAIGNTKNPIRPSAAENELLVLVVSVSNSFLHPTDKEYELLQSRAKTTKKPPPGPKQSFLFYDPVRFKMLSPEDKPMPAIAIAPLPFAFDKGGFKEGDMRESSTDLHPPEKRAMIAVVWEVPQGMNDPIKVRFDQWPPVSVPSTDLDRYSWFPPDNEK